MPWSMAHQTTYSLIPSSRAAVIHIYNTLLSFKVSPQCVHRQYSEIMYIHYFRILHVHTFWWTHIQWVCAHILVHTHTVCAHFLVHMHTVCAHILVNTHTVSSSVCTHFGAHAYSVCTILSSCISMYIALPSISAAEMYTLPPYSTLLLLDNWIVSSKVILRILLLHANFATSTPRQSPFPPLKCGWLLMQNKLSGNEEKWVELNSAIAVAGAL